VGTTRVKICGLTSLEDAEHAVEAGAWAVGCILWPGSKRRCDLAEAERIARTLRRRAEVVGVFVDAPLDELVEVVDAVRFTVVQLHGGEGPIYADTVARRTGAKVIKAARVRDGADLQALAAYRHADLHLLDTYVAGTPGGTGRTWDWELLRRRRSPVPALVSGGLSPDNVGAAIAAARPWGVDVAGGTESAPGVKDREKVEAFIAAVRAADREHEETHA
jgi:phosphoribosylanthranilate isomerase